MKQIHSLFSVGIASYKFSKGVTERESEYIKSRLYNKNVSNCTTNDFQLVENEILSNIKEFCLAAANDYFQNILKKKHKLRITSSWANVNDFQESHHSHYHKNSVLSGVFYLNDTFSSPIIFHNPNSIKDFWDCESVDYNEFNSEFIKIGVEKNTCLIFPSWLFHSVDCNLINEGRYSITFNTFFEKDIVLSSEKSLYLNL